MTSGFWESNKNNEKKRSCRPTSRKFPDNYWIHNNLTGPVYELIHSTLDKIDNGRWTDLSKLERLHQNSKTVHDEYRSIDDNFKVVFLILE